ncbi:hypothetical protein PROFUN_15301 [Planoprotostelium fungivorum]|uniref:Kinesin motor domain-containing protein n=1 Tax=Planoprotostelium fungivorum TaxID=1890364 RepID=A0A2P6MXB1_9EUKA|nr:hypothetical protein PROFUN_15301 [Planoprotostelium fungivorum]
MTRFGLDDEYDEENVIEPDRLSMEGISNFGQTGRPDSDIEYEEEKGSDVDILDRETVCESAEIKNEQTQDVPEEEEEEKEKDNGDWESNEYGGFYAQEKIRELETDNEFLKAEYTRVQKEKRDVFNQLQELRGNIRVFCRVRPSKEDSEGTVTYGRDGDQVSNIQVDHKRFALDHIFTPDNSQDDVFKQVEPLISSLIDGYSVCIFAYGQTGSGKTYTMEGTEEDPGINLRALSLLYHEIENRSHAGTARFEITGTAFEIYNETYRDLLAEADTKTKITVLQSEDKINVKGATERQLKTYDETYQFLEDAKKNRSVGATDANQDSSRSHSVFRFEIFQHNLISNHSTRSKFFLIDLAGCERQSKTNATGDRMRESCHINKSLSALGNVMSALHSRSGHIPYRSSKLTALLQDSFGGHSKVLMMVQLSPDESDSQETVNSLQFATRACSIELGAAQKNILGVDSGPSRSTKATKQHEAEMRIKDEALKQLKMQLHAAEERAKKSDNANKITSNRHNRYVKDKEAEIQMLKNELATANKLVVTLKRQNERQASENSAPKKVHEVRLNQTMPKGQSFRGLSETVNGTLSKRTGLAATGGLPKRANFTVQASSTTTATTKTTKKRPSQEDKSTLTKKRRVRQK